MLKLTSLILNRERQLEFIHQPAETNRLGDVLNEHLRGDWDDFRAAIAFAKRSGTRHLAEALKKFCESKHAEILIGIDHEGTSAEALEDILHATQPNGESFIIHNEIASTFHPKIYIFRKKDYAVVVIGSGNLTEGGLYTNYEASTLLHLDLTQKSDLQFLKNIDEALNSWKYDTSGISKPLSSQLVQTLVANGYIPVEKLLKKAKSKKNDKTSGEDPSTPKTEKIFSSQNVPRAPKISKPKVKESTKKAKPTSKDISQVLTEVTGFVMTLQNTDVGTGQTTKGTSRRSPEIFIPLTAARDMEPEFWGWNEKFVDSPTKRDRSNVKMKIGSNIIEVNMMSWKKKSDLRLRHEALRSAGNIGDILRMELVDPSLGYDYYVEIIPQGTTMHETYDKLCNVQVRKPSKKRFGYY